MRNLIILQSFLSGRVPRLHDQMGQTFSVCAVEAVSEFEQEQMKNRQALNQLEREVAILNDKIDPTPEELAVRTITIAYS